MGFANLVDVLPLGDDGRAQCSLVRVARQEVGRFMRGCAGRNLSGYELQSVVHHHLGVVDRRQGCPLLEPRSFAGAETLRDP